MQGAEVLTRFTADTKDFDSKVKGLNTSVGSIAKGILVATGVTKALSAAFNLVRGSMDGAISRFDTMNNFPKVMSNLGISAEDSQKSIDKLSKKLSGLPTTLDSAALSVQRLTSKNGDVKKSTDLFLAMNNAILAGGTSSEIQASAIEQLSQAYAKGKPDMMEWRTLMMAMPAQLKQVATAMGYVSADELGESLREGTVSMDDFMNTIDKLNKEGVAGFKSFEEQARNATGGISTSITNMKTAVVRGTTNIIDSIDKALANSPIGGIGYLISNIGKTFEKGLTGFGKFAGDILSKVLNKEMTLEEAGATVSNKISQLFLKGIKELNKILPQMIQNLIDFLLGAINGLLPYIPPIIKNVINGIINAFLKIVDNLDKIIDTGIDLIIALTDGIIEALPTLIDKMPIIIEKITNALIKASPKIAQAAITIIGKLLWALITNAPSLLKGTGQIISTITRGLASLPSQMINIGKNIISGIINGMTNMVGTAINKAKSIGKSILNGVKSVLGIHSPSTEFAFVGKMSILGFTNELDKMQKQVQSQIAETFSISPQLSATTGMHYSPNVQVYNNVDIKQDPLGQMVNTVKTYSGGAKNDYCYGAGIK